MSRVAVVTGSNKGIGLSIVKGLLRRFDGVVYLTSRSEARGRAALQELSELGLRPEYHQLDVGDRESVIRFRDHIKATHGGLDLLINNAAVANLRKHDRDYEKAKYLMDINFYGVVTMEELIFPLVRDNGRIINISSDCGHLSNVRNKHWIERLSKKDLTRKDIDEFVHWYLDSIKNGTFNSDDIADNGVFASYRVSKVALSALTMLQQKDLESRNISVNSMHPGLVQTDMTAHVGFLTAERAADTPLYLALEAPASLRGAYVWHDGNVLDWYDHTADYYFKCITLIP